MIIRDVIFGDGSILDIMWGLTTGVAVGYVLDYLCAGPLGLVLRPMFIALGFGYQFQQVMEAIKSGDALKITTQILEMTLMAYDVTRQGHLGDNKTRVVMIQKILL